MIAMQWNASSDMPYRRIDFCAMLGCAVYGSPRSRAQVFNACYKREEAPVLGRLLPLRNMIISIKLGAIAARLLISLEQAFLFPCRVRTMHARIRSDRW